MEIRNQYGKFDIVGEADDKSKVYRMDNNELYIHGTIEELVDIYNEGKILNDNNLKAILFYEDRGGLIEFMSRDKAISISVKDVYIDYTKPLTLDDLARDIKRRMLPSPKKKDPKEFER